ncbi:MAG: nitrous oxide reductase accessory protein NosL [Anaerolineae bacterium]|nr:nitrous oxide reductase accessory protein NosL [Anaerolineae bacterium]MDW8098659.1 nitrous oxide reductase accessory protein NosL [Anaerolineae bacterium]
MRGQVLVGLVIIGFLILGCQPPVSLDKAPDIRYGEDVCDKCRMIINEARFAAAYVTRQGEVRRFDDIGDMVQYHQEHAEEVAVFWVHDFETEEWLRADQAFFVSSADIHTPMGHGIVALGEKDRADRLAASSQGRVLTWSELLTQPITSQNTPQPTHSHE